MVRVRNKPKESWLSRAKYEIENAEELLIKRQKQLSKIREHGFTPDEALREWDCPPKEEKL